MKRRCLALIDLNKCANAASEDALSSKLLPFYSCVGLLVDDSEEREREKKNACTISVMKR